MLARKLLRDLSARRVRTLLTVAGVLVGVAGLVAIISTARGFERAQRAAFASGDRADLSLFLYDAPASLLRSIERVSGIEAADLRINHYGRGRLGAGGALEDVQFIGLRSLDYQPVDRLVLVAGRLPGPDEALIEPAAAASRRLRLGDPVTFVDRDGREQRLSVSGIARLPSMLSSDLRGIPLLFVSDRTARRMATAAGYNELVATLEPDASRPALREALTALLTRRAIPRGDFRFADPSNYPGKRELDALFLILYLFSGLGLVLSGFLVANTLAASVTEATREIGILKSIGATRGQILANFLLAAALYGLLGTLLGLALGSVGGYALLRVLGRVASIAPAFHPEPMALLAGAAVGLVVPLLGGAIPAWQAASLSAKAALEARGISSDFGRSRLDRAAQRLTQGNPPLAAMGPRNLLRRRGRSAVTILVVALAVGALLAAQATDASVNRAIFDIFGVYRADAYLDVAQPLRASEAGVLRRVPGITRAEPWLVRPCAAGLTATRCWALPPDTTLYAPLLLAGRWLDAAEPRGVVLTDDLARRNRLSVGDSFTLRYRERTQQVTVLGIVRDNAIFLGSTVTSKLFMPFAMMASLSNSEGADFFAVGMAPGSLAEQRVVMEALGYRLRHLEPSGTLAISEYESTRELTQILTLALRAMVVLVGVIGAAGLLNTLALGVLERRREIGVLRALGSDARQIAALFLAEGVALGLLGWLAGLLLGVGMAYGFVRALSTALFQLPLVIPPQVGVGTLAFALLIALVASVVPALAAARLPTVEALRYE